MFLCAAQIFCARRPCQQCAFAHARSVEGTVLISTEIVNICLHEKQFISSYILILSNINYKIDQILGNAQYSSV